MAAASEELRQPNVNRAALEQIAASSGGQLVELPDLDSHPGASQGRVELSGSCTARPDLWDNWLTLALLICLYWLDVGIRRLLGLS